jgi:hypothetical protein
VRKIHLLKLHSDFENLHMHASENFSEYFARLLVICNQMKRYREKIKETRMVEKTYVCCKKKFHYMMVAIEKSQNMDVISIQDLIAKVQAHEKRVNEIRECGCTCIFFIVR